MCFEHSLGLSTDAVVRSSSFDAGDGAKKGKGQDSSDEKNVRFGQVRPMGKGLTGATAE